MHPGILEIALALHEQSSPTVLPSNVMVANVVNIATLHGSVEWLLVEAKKSRGPHGSSPSDALRKLHSLIGITAQPGETFDVKILALDVHKRADAPKTKDWTEVEDVEGLFCRGILVRVTYARED